ncbi:MAG: hypothetical protein ABSF46_33625 [Terriglobia bacterium]|jgi:hypothetical protein
MHDGQAGNLPKVPDIRGPYAVAKLKRGHPNQKVCERDFQPMALDFTIESAGTQSDGYGDWVDRHGAY